LQSPKYLQMRFLIALSAALVINLLLFSVMQVMVGQKNIRLSESITARPIDFIRVRESREPVKTRRRTEPPPMPVSEPLSRPLELSGPAPISDEAKPVPLPSFTPLKTLALPSGLDLEGGPYIGEVAGDGRPWFDVNELDQLVRFPPAYPPKAKLRGIEGFVVVEFTVTKEGGVKNARIIEASPSAIFNRAVLRAVRRWKFTPRREEGKTIDVVARQRIEFRLKR